MTARVTKTDVGASSEHEHRKLNAVADAAAALERAVAQQKAARLGLPRSELGQRAARSEVEARCPSPCCSMIWSSPSRLSRDDDEARSPTNCTPSTSSASR